ncbi:MAG TPA: HEAT repeat domain-containing protein, partial [Spirochaetia bacterium]|nr:HEAT repeat domain-containing protein [Spirochaetia bacterium]
RISSTRDGRFTKELVSVVGETRSADVKKAILGVFEEQRLKEGEGAARQLLSDAEHQSGDVLIASIQYLSAISAAGLAPLLVPLIDSADSGVASASIRACGKSAEPGCTAALEAKLKNPDFPDARKADLILALGDLKDQKALDDLIAIAKNPDEDKVRRLYSADALGKIGDARALPVLKGMFAENDALVRAYAASALAHFSVDEVFPMLIQGVKDNDWRVREQCARALGGPLSGGQIDAALPALEYKARYDPVSQVRSAAIKAIGSLGSGQSDDILARLYQTSGNPLETRESALRALTGRSLSRAIDAARAVFAAEGKAFDQKPIEATARVLSEAQGAGLKDIYSTLLGSSDAVVRAYAVRGIGANGISDMRDRVKELSTKDASPLVQREAEKALSKL